MPERRSQSNSRNQTSRTSNEADLSSQRHLSPRPSKQPVKRTSVVGLYPRTSISLVDGRVSIQKNHKNTEIPILLSDKPQTSGYISGNQ